MRDPEERAELLKRHDDLMAKLQRPEVRARMIADGRDPEEAIKRLTALKDNVLAKGEAADKAEEELLHAHADEADAARELFKTLRQAIRELRRSNPLHPQLEEWEDALEAWAQEMPKEP